MTNLLTFAVTPHSQIVFSKDKKMLPEFGNTARRQLGTWLILVTVFPYVVTLVLERLQPLNDIFQPPVNVLYKSLVLIGVNRHSDKHATGKSP